MVKDSQVRRLRKMEQQGKKLYESAARSGMDEKTARWKSQVEFTYLWKIVFT